MPERSQGHARCSGGRSHEAGVFGSSVFMCFFIGGITLLCGQDFVSVQLFSFSEVFFSLIEFRNCYLVICIFEKIVDLDLKTGFLSF